MLEQLKVSKIKNVTREDGTLQFNYEGFKVKVSRRVTSQWTVALRVVVDGTPWHDCEATTEDRLAWDALMELEFGHREQRNTDLRGRFSEALKD